ncbi:hypothetical protein AWJ20_5144 [Sugiyamaella lignohabitans]|uniref:Zinc finger PHD-type domain-containing protein n=1 Tax=Sugiyamaella lignohabitans TaxID=796027 RepID=A0A167EKJ5_9ASCO|nr:uncharacterized protein AWJ20_5144 [Sugiyamaella lignohabitans]ANB14185.1 hypothetical protein AWJ20_5144 [Sugiyamaella lignohabitans]
MGRPKGSYGIKRIQALAGPPVIPLDDDQYQEVLKKLRDSWELCSITQFLSFFRPILGIPASPETDSARDVLEEDLIGLNGPVGALLPQLVRALIAALTVGVKVSAYNDYEDTNERLWKLFVRKGYIFDDGETTGTKIFGKYNEETDSFERKFTELDAESKVKAIAHVVRWVSIDDRFRTKIEAMDVPVEEFRIAPIGWKGDFGSYYLFDDNRLYLKTDFEPYIDDVLEAREKEEEEARLAAEAEAEAAAAAAAEAARKKKRRRSNRPFGSSYKRRKRSTSNKYRSKSEDDEDNEDNEDVEEGGEGDEGNGGDDSVNHQTNGNEDVDMKQEDGEAEAEDSVPEPVPTMGEALAREYEPEFECVCWHLESWKAFVDQLKKSKQAGEKQLHNYLVKHVMPVIEAHEETRVKTALARVKVRTTALLVANRKRSSRLEEKHQRELEEQAIREEQDRQRRVQEEEERLENERLMKEELREQRFMERERRKLDRHSQIERLRSMTPASENGTSDEGSLRKSSRRQELQQQKAQQELSQMESEDSWVFDCTCGVYGENYDDGTLSVACERCNTWMHVACLPQEERESVLKSISEKEEQEENKQRKAEAEAAAAAAAAAASTATETEAGIDGEATNATGSNNQTDVTATSTTSNTVSTDDSRRARTDSSDTEASEYAFICDRCTAKAKRDYENALKAAAEAERKRLDEERERERLEKERLKAEADARARAQARAQAQAQAEAQARAQAKAQLQTQSQAHSQTPHTAQFFQSSFQVHPQTAPNPPQGQFQTPAARPGGGLPAYGSFQTTSSTPSSLSSSSTSPVLSRPIQPHQETTAATTMTTTKTPSSDSHSGTHPQLAADRPVQPVISSQQPSNLHDPRSIVRPAHAGTGSGQADPFQSHPVNQQQQLPPSTRETVLTSAPATVSASVTSASPASLAAVSAPRVPLAGPAPPAAGAVATPVSQPPLNHANGHANGTIAGVGSPTTTATSTTTPSTKPSDTRPTKTTSSDWRQNQPGLDSTRNGNTLPSHDPQSHSPSSPAPPPPVLSPTSTNPALATPISSGDTNAHDRVNGHSK